MGLAGRNYRRRHYDAFRSGIGNCNTRSNDEKCLKKSDRSGYGLENAFNNADGNDDNEISRAELKAFLGTDVDDETIDQMMTTADINGDGMIDLDEFKRIMRAVPKEEDEDDDAQRRVIYSFVGTFDSSNGIAAGIAALLSGVEASDVEVRTPCRIKRATLVHAVVPHHCLAILPGHLVPPVQQ